MQHLEIFEIDSVDAICLQNGLDFDDIREIYRASANIGMNNAFLLSVGALAAADCPVKRENLENICLDIMSEVGNPPQLLTLLDELIQSEAEIRQMKSLLLASAFLDFIRDCP